MPVRTDRRAGEAIAADDINAVAALANATETAAANAGITRWYGDGPPGVIVGSSPGDEYLDRLTGDLYTLT